MLQRRKLVSTLLADRPANLLAVSSLGSPTWDLSAAGNHPANFCFIGAMGQAAPFALGLALAQPDKRVVLFAGDGEILMALGSLATIANQAPANLAIIVLDNQSYYETGDQPTATAGRTDLMAVARGCGFEAGLEIRAEHEIDDLRAAMLAQSGPVFALAHIGIEKLPLAFPYSFDGVTAMDRFRQTVNAGAE